MKRRYAVLAGTTVLATLIPTSVCHADVLPSFPDPHAPETMWILMAGVAFVVVVSGASFYLLRRIAHRRVDQAPDVSAASTEDTPSALRDDALSAPPARSQVEEARDED
jgi:hypothetical protein